MKQKILFLTLKPFSVTGGIQKVSRIMMRALSDIQQKHLIQLKVWSMYDKTGQADERYIKKDIFKACGGNKIAYALLTVFHGIKSHTLILSHVNLLLIAYITSLFVPKIRVILIAHGIEIWRDLPGWKKRFIRRKKVEIWAVSRYTAGVVANKHQIPKENIKVLNNCLDPFLALPQTFEKPGYLLKKHQLKKEQPVLFTLTRLASSEKYKGYDLVIDTIPELIKIYPDLIYLIGGKGDQTELKRIHQRIEDKNLAAHVQLVGFISDEELSDYFLLADIFVMPSRKEGFGIVFIEAAACGCKIIGGNEDGTVDALLDGELGTLVTPQNKEAMLDAVFNALKAGRSVDQAQAIQQKCLAHFNYPQYVKQVRQYLQSA